jgi:hypothetical protein
MILKKQDIFELPLSTINSMSQVELEQWIKQEHIAPLHQWLLPQLVAHFGTWKLVKDSGDRWDILATLKHNVGQDPKLQGLWKLSRVTRSLLLPSQTQHPQYAQFTPLILMGFKLYKDVPYGSWQGLKHLEYLLEPKLLEAVNLSAEQLQVVGDLGSEELLAIRSEGLMNKSGKKAGELKPAESTWALTGIQHTKLGTLPKLTQSMLTQIWIAHPSKRTKYMILDPINWDLMPEPLVTSEIFTVPEQTQPKQDTFAMPWL